MKYLSSIFVFLVGFISAQNTIEMIEFPKMQSNINIPIRLHLSEVSGMINQSIGGLIFEDDSYSDNNNDQSKTKVWKDGSIEITGLKNQEVLIKVPLKVWVKKGIGTMGMYTYQETTFKTEMYFSSSVTLKSDWKIELSTIPKGFKWIQKPVLDFGMIKIPVTSLVEKSLTKEQVKFCTIIDKEAREKLDFKQYAVEAWNKISEPLEISEEYNTWLKLTPIHLKVTPFKFYRNAIDFKIGLGVYTETFVGAKPDDSEKFLAIDDFHFVSEIDDNFLLKTTTNITYDHATSIAEDLFLNKTYKVKGQAITISSINVDRNEDRVVINVNTTGAINGLSSISGIPIYDKASQKIVLTNTKFKLKTKNIFHKALAFVFKNKIVKTIEQEYGIPVADMIVEAEKNITENLNKEQYSGITTSGEVISLKPTNVIVTSRGLTTAIDVEAQLNLLIKDMKF